MDAFYCMKNLTTVALWVFGRRFGQKSRLQCSLTETALNSLQVTPSSVLTLREVYDSIKRRGYKINFNRVPVTDERLALSC